MDDPNQLAQQKKKKSFMVIEIKFSMDSVLVLSMTTTYRVPGLL